ncbi:cytochrome b/b6 domain-containing protein [Mariprofundus micogutta]|nr:cytochrome b/b6 domain-containing protein [Mariprofundus micogutta]
MHIVSDKGYHPVTRWLHAGLVLGVMFQLIGALLMAHPDHADTGRNGLVMNHEAVAAEVAHSEHEANELGKFFMSAHRTGGTVVAAIVLVNLIWAVVLRGAPRKRQMSVLGSSRHWHEALSIAKNIPSMLLGRIPLPEPGNSLSLVFEMLGLLTMTTMAVSGTVIWMLWDGPGNTVSAMAETLMGVHASVAVILLLYLVGHVSMALMHAKAGDPVFNRILPKRKRSTAAQGDKL